MHLYSLECFKQVLNIFKRYVILINLVFHSGFITRSFCHLEMTCLDFFSLDEKFLKFILLQCSFQNFKDYDYSQTVEMPYYFYKRYGIPRVLSNNSSIHL